MIGALKQTTSRFAIAAAAGLFTGGIALTPVQAASLGGDCCADLEERVAELEATTVRKGNRKVSVKLSGQVHRVILFWDDGEDSDVFFTDNDASNTRFRITGSATISPGRTAGFRIEQDINISNNSSVVANCAAAGVCRPRANQQGNNTTENDIDTRYMDLWVKDETYGKFSSGRGDTASNGTQEVDLSGTGLVTYVNQADIGSSFRYRDAAGLATAVTVGGSIPGFDGGSRQDRIRYDTPTLGGFKFSTSLAADDFVDGAIRFKKEWNSVRCAAALGVAHFTSEDSDDEWVTDGSASCMHTPSGLNLTISYGERDRGDSSPRDSSHFYIKGGISRRWNSHGKTNIAIGYGHVEEALLETDDTDHYSVAVVQKIDSAALELYAAWIHYEYDDGVVGTTFQDIDIVTLGARMKF